MMQCPKCSKEIRYIAGAPSSGRVPIAVDLLPETIVSESGRRITGYREHVCKPGSELLIDDIPNSPTSGYLPGNSSTGGLCQQ